MRTLLIVCSLSFVIFTLKPASLWAQAITCEDLLTSSEVVQSPYESALQDAREARRIRTMSLNRASRSNPGIAMANEIPYPILVDLALSSESPRLQIPEGYDFLIRQNESLLSDIRAEIWSRIRSSFRGMAPPAMQSSQSAQTQRLDEVGYAIAFAMSTPFDGEERVPQQIYRRRFYDFVQFKMLTDSPQSSRELAQRWQITVSGTEALSRFWRREISRKATESLRNSGTPGSDFEVESLIERIGFDHVLRIVLDLPQLPSEQQIPFDQENWLRELVLKRYLTMTEKLNAQDDFIGFQTASIEELAMALFIARGRIIEQAGQNPGGPLRQLETLNFLNFRIITLRQLPAVLFAQRLGMDLDTISSSERKLRTDLYNEMKSIMAILRPDQP